MVTEVKNAKKLIKEFYPDFPFLKGNDYSILFYDDVVRLSFIRKASKWFKIKSTLKIPFVYIPLCFKYGYPTINKTIYEVYNGSWVVSDAYEKDKYDKIKEYIKENNLD